MKQSLSWIMAGIVGVGLAAWQSGALNSVNHRGETEQQAQTLSEVEVPPSKTLTSKAKVEKPKTVLDSSRLLQESLSRLNRVTPPAGKSTDQSTASGSANLMAVSSQAMAAYKEERTQAEQEGLQYLLDLLYNTEGDAKMEVITALWRYAAKIGVPEEVLTALELATRDADIDVAREAEKALADLRRFKRRMEEGPTPEEIALQPPPPPASPDHTGASTGKNVAVDDAEYQARLVEYETAMQQRETAAIQALEEKLHTATDEEAFNEALHGLSLHRSDASVDAWLQLVNDGNFNVREEAVQNLWRSAANGLDRDGRIIAALQGAAGDSDKDVALLAQQALADLENFKRRQAAAALAPPVVQSAPARENGGDASDMSGTVP